MCACMEGDRECMDVGVAVKGWEGNSDNYVCAY